MWSARNAGKVAFPDFQVQFCGDRVPQSHGRLVKLRNLEGDLLQVVLQNPGKET